MNDKTTTMLHPTMEAYSPTTTEGEKKMIRLFTIRKCLLVKKNMIIAFLIRKPSCWRGMTISPDDANIESQSYW
jgi:hypothetical protein